MSNSYESFKKYEVKANSVEDFLKRYTKHNKHYGRGEEHVLIRIKSHTEELEKYGFTIITHHGSVTGDTVSYYGNSL